MYHVITFVNNNTSFNCILSILSLNFILLSMPNEFWLESRLCNIAYALCTSLHFPSMYHVYHLKSGLNVRSIFMIRSIIRYASNYTLLCERILKVGLYLLRILRVMIHLIKINASKYWNRSIIQPAFHRQKKRKRHDYIQLV